MGGWFVDVFVAYLFKAATRCLRLSGSAEWPTVNATVTASECPPKVLGCSSAEVAYSYVLGGQSYTGLHEKPFISPNSAQEYVRRFTPGTSIIARVKPDMPATTVVRDADQRGLNVEPSRPLRQS
jgi:hypothetical protein